MNTLMPRASALVLALALGASFASLVVPAALADDRPTTAKERPVADAPPPQQERLISLVLLLREPRKLDHHAASAAAGADFPEESVEDKAPYHRVRLKSGSYVISDVAEPYFEKPAEVAADVKGEHMRAAILEHRGWIGVDWAGKGEPEDVRATYQQIGKMLASLAGRDVLAIYSPELDSFAHFDGDAKATLIGRDPLALFPVPASAPSKETAARTDAPAQLRAGAPDGVAIADDDPALKTARAEARRRWPEFVSAFNGRKSGQYFGVKGPFEEGDRREFMWLTVDDIDGEEVHGRLESQPASLKGWKREQDIHIKVSNVDDWLYVTPEKEAVGGFSEKVLSEVAVKSRVSDDRPAPRKEVP